MPGVLAGGLLAFALSIDDYVITSFNSGSTVTYPLWIFGASQRGVPPQVNVLAAMIFLFTVAVMAFTVWQQRRAEKLAGALAD
jgi:spermidine/putrescine transport system permease protein